MCFLEQKTLVDHVNFLTGILINYLLDRVDTILAEVHFLSGRVCSFLAQMRDNLAFVKLRFHQVMDLFVKRAVLISLALELCNGSVLSSEFEVCSDCMLIHLRPLHG